MKGARGVSRESAICTLFDGLIGYVIVSVTPVIGHEVVQNVIDADGSHQAACIIYYSQAVRL